MKVMSLWMRRTSKIFLRPRPSFLSQVRFLSRSSHSSYSLPNWPVFQRCSMSRKQLDAELVRVEPAALSGHGAGVVVGVVDALRDGSRAFCGHDGASASSWPSLRS